MIWEHAVALGAIQGLTEFLPISSSGHLVLFQKLAGYNPPPVILDAIMHTATLGAVCIYFRKKITNLKLSDYKIIAIASIPAILVGTIVSPYIDQIFNSLKIITFGFIVTGIVLISTNKTLPTSKSKKISVKNAIIIGFFQALALLPGISRSATTITSGLHLGISKEQIFPFSFIMSIPIILGATAMQLISSNAESNINTSIMFIGFASAFIFGIAALSLLEKLLSNSKLHYFGYYCIILGITISFL